MGGGQKAKNFKKSFKQLLSYAKTYHVFIGIAFVLAFIGTILNIVGPDLIKQMTNEITKAIDFRPEQGIFPSQTIDMELIGRIGLTLVIFYSLGFIFNYIQGFMLTTVSQRVSNRFRKDIAIKMNKIPFKYYDTTNIGDILSRMTNDVDMVRSNLPTIIWFISDCSNHVYWFDCYDVYYKLDFSTYCNWCILNWICLYDVDCDAISKIL